VVLTIDMNFIYDVIPEVICALFIWIVCDNLKMELLFLDNHIMFQN